MVHRNLADSLTKDIIGLLSANLVHPFGLAYPPLIHVSISVLQQLFSIAWPRLAYYRGELLKGLTISWLKIQEDGKESNELEGIRRDIEISLEMLTVILEMEIDVNTEYRTLIDRDPRLQKLLMPQQSSA